MPIQEHSVSAGSGGDAVNGEPATAPVATTTIPALQRTLADTQAQLAALQRQQAALSHGISHDLRAPLRAISSYAALLDSQNAQQLPESGRQHLARIREAAGRMGGLLDGLLELSRIERHALQPEAVDVSMLAEWTAAELRDAHPGVQADITIQPGLEAWADERLLKIALAELLANAWGFSAHAPPIRIEVTGDTADGWLRLHVRDHGRGFQTEYAQRIFEPFQRLHTADSGSGSGLGLAVAARITERLDGRIAAHSDGPDRGSRFSMELPLPPPATDDP